MDDGRFIDLEDIVPPFLLAGDFQDKKCKRRFREVTVAEYVEYRGHGLYPRCKWRLK